MKAIYLHTAGAVALTFGLGLTLAACVPNAQPPAPTPAPAPVATPAPTPTPAPPPPVQERQYDNYLDAPQTPGTWEYSDERTITTAAFGRETDYDFIFACDVRRQVIGLGRHTLGPLTGARTMEISTETVSRQFELRPHSRGDALFITELAANDPFLDAMAITKGRIAIGVEGERTLYLPAWVEISRVIEDCR